jgi:uncharacterized membrane protein YgdD (TMEM256/DUF423 family)
MNINENCVLHGDRLTRIEVMMESLRDDYLEGIKEQVTRTNGRVTATESAIVDLGKIAVRNRTVISILWTCLAGIALFMGGLLAQHIVSDRVTDLGQITAAK